MDMKFAIPNVEKCKSRADVAKRVAHNLRIRHAAPWADAERSGQNIHLFAATPEAVLAELDARLATVNVQKNATLAVELMLGTSSEWFDAGGDPVVFATECVDWSAKFFGLENILAASLHMDEKTPHVQLLVVPIVIKPNGRKHHQVEAQLSASHYFDGVARLHAFHDSFAEHMKPLGLVRGLKREPGEPLKRHVKLRQFYRLVNRITAEVERATYDAPQLPLRDESGRVSDGDWQKLEAELNQQAELVRELQADATAGKMLLTSSAGKALAQRAEVIRERERKARQRIATETTRIQTASTELETRRARALWVERSMAVHWQNIKSDAAKAQAEITDRLEALQLGQLESYRADLLDEVETLRAEIDGLQRQRG